MAGIVQYIKCPSKGKTAGRKDILVATALYFVVPPLLSSIVFVISELCGGSSLIRLAPVNPHFYKLFIVVILEEISFRLPLRDKTVYRVLSSLALSTILGQLFFFSSTRLLLCLILVLIIAGALFLLEELMFKYVSFPIIFYLSAVAFGLFHLVNLGFNSLGISSLLLGFMYCFDKTLGGILLGYLRIQVNIFYVIILHLLYDLAPFALEHMVNLISG